MSPKQKKINDAKKRIRDRAKRLLPKEVYEKSCELGQAEYSSDEEFFRAVVNLSKWADKKINTTKKKVA